MGMVRHNRWTSGRLRAGMLGLVLMLLPLFVLSLRGPLTPVQAQVSRQTLSFNARATRQHVVEMASAQAASPQVIDLDLAWLTLQPVDMDLDGILTLDVTADGRLDGILTTEDGTVIPVTGTSTGLSVSLTVTAAPDQIWFATGTTTAPLRDGPIHAGAGSIVVLTPTGPAVGFWMMCGADVPLCP